MMAKQRFGPTESTLSLLRGIYIPLVCHHLCLILRFSKNSANKLKTDWTTRSFFQRSSSRRVFRFAKASDQGEQLSVARRQFRSRDKCRDLVPEKGEIVMQGLGEILMRNLEVCSDDSASQHLPGSVWLRLLWSCFDLIYSSKMWCKIICTVRQEKINLLVLVG